MRAAWTLSTNVLRASRKTSPNGRSLQSKSVAFSPQWPALLTRSTTPGKQLIRSDFSFYRHAFNAYRLLLKEYESAKDSEIDAASDLAHRCIVLAIKSKSVINFEELSALKAVKLLATKEKDFFAFFNLFITSDARDFKGQVQGYSKILEAEHISLEEAINKKSYLQICTLSTETSTNFKYSELSKLLNIDENGIEEWAIEAI